MHRTVALVVVLGCSSHAKTNEVPQDVAEARFHEALPKLEAFERHVAGMLEHLPGDEMCAHGGGGDPAITAPVVADIGHLASAAGADTAQITFACTNPGGGTIIATYNNFWSSVSGHGEHLDDHDLLWGTSSPPNSAEFSALFVTRYVPTANHFIKVDTMFRLR